MIGLNFTSPAQIPIIKSLLNRGAADFVEILIDNFMHLNPQNFYDAFGDTPVSIHMMNSGFIDGDETWKWYCTKIKKICNILKPIYISDHIFSAEFGNKESLFRSDFDYSGKYQKLCNAVTRWQSSLQTQILFENFPSLLPHGKEQKECFIHLQKDTYCGVLFDFSNAIVAEKNCGLEASSWLPIVGSHSHIGGFRNDDFFSFDTHDCCVAQKSLDLCMKATTIKTLVVERDTNFDVSSWYEDCTKSRNAIRHMVSSNVE